MYTIAGSSAEASGLTGNGGAATSALLNGPRQIALDTSGNLYIADYGNNRVQMVPAVNGTYFGASMTAYDVYTIAGSATGSSGTSGDGGPATSALLSGPKGLVFDLSGNLIIGDFGNSRVQILPVTSGTYFGQAMTANDIYTIAGSVTGSHGTSGDGGPASSALLYNQWGLAIDSSGNLYIGDAANNRIQMVPVNSGTYWGQSMTTYDMYTIAGSAAGSSGTSGDGGAATSAFLSAPHGVSFDSSGNLYIADYNNNRIQLVPKISGTYFGQSMTANDIYTIAGSSSGAVGSSGNGGAATSALLDNPADMVIDSSGNVYIVDTVNKLIRELFH